MTKKVFYLAGGLLLALVCFVLWFTLTPTEDSVAQRSSQEAAAIIPPSMLPGEEFTGDLPEMRKRGVVRALVTYSMTDFFVAAGRIRGIQAEFLREYEKLLNKDIKREHEKIKLLFIPVTFAELIPALRSGKGDIAAAFLTITPERAAQVDFVTSGRMKVNEVVVTRKTDNPIGGIEDLAGQRLYVLRGSSYVGHLGALNERFRNRGLDPMEVEEADSHLLSEDILEMVNAGVVPATVVDDFKGRLWAQTLEQLDVHEDLVIARDTQVGWAIRKNSPRLKASLERFVAKAEVGTLLGNMLFKRYFEDTRWIENPLADSERQRYAQYVALFRKYGRQYGFDHLALVAQAFRESGLDHTRRSPRGAVGLMQLLPSTAKGKNVGIPDISSPEDNVHAGAKYLAFLRDRYFSDEGLAQVDQLAFTWAAYNAGPAKVRKMRTLAKKMGRDPNRWFGHVEIAAGKVVGRETVKYVDDIYKYYVAYQLVERLKQAKT